MKSLSHSEDTHSDSHSDSRSHTPTHSRTHSFARTTRHARHDTSNSHSASRSRTHTHSRTHSFARTTRHARHVTHGTRRETRSAKRAVACIPGWTHTPNLRFPVGSHTQPPIPGWLTPPTSDHAHTQLRTHARTTRHARHAYATRNSELDFPVGLTPPTYDF